MVDFYIFFKTSFRDCKTIFMCISVLKYILYVTLLVLIRYFVGFVNLLVGDGDDNVYRQTLIG